MLVARRTLNKLPLDALETVEIVIRFGACENQEIVLVVDFRLIFWYHFRVAGAPSAAGMFFENLDC